MNHQVKPHIQVLLTAELTTNNKYGGCISFDRTGHNTIIVSCIGYKHQDLYDIEAELLKLGCRYDFDKGVQDFDQMSGRTFTHFIEPKK